MTQVQRSELRNGYASKTPEAASGTTKHHKTVTRRGAFRKLREGTPTPRGLSFDADSAQRGRESAAGLGPAAAAPFPQPRDGELGDRAPLPAAAAGCFAGCFRGE